MCVCAAKNSDVALAEDAVVIDLSVLKTVTVDVEGKVHVYPYYYSVKCPFERNNKAITIFIYFTLLVNVWLLTFIVVSDLIQYRHIFNLYFTVLCINHFRLLS